MRNRPMTNAERQAKLYADRRGAGYQKVGAWLDNAARAQLAALQRDHNLTQEQAINAALRAVDSAAVGREARLMK